MPITTTTTTATTTRPKTMQPQLPLQIYRYNSTKSRSAKNLQARMIPRAHATKPTQHNRQQQQQEEEETEKPSTNTNINKKETDQNPKPKPKQKLNQKKRTEESESEFDIDFDKELEILEQKDQQRNQQQQNDLQKQEASDLSTLNILSGIPSPTTAIDSCMDDGFQLDNGLRIENGDGVILVGGEAFSWRPWEIGNGQLVNDKGQFEVDDLLAWGVFNIVFPRPGEITFFFFSSFFFFFFFSSLLTILLIYIELLILGIGTTLFPLSPNTKRQINSLGMRVEVLDTRNAAAQFNLLATERGVSEIAAALIPMGWNGGSIYHG